jgi:hypothetical protein
MASWTIIDALAGGSIIELTPTQAFTLFKKVADNDTWASSDAYFRFNPRGTSKESSKWRRKTYSKARSFRLCGGWRRWRKKRMRFKT